RSHLHVYLLRVLSQCLSRGPPRTVPFSLSLHDALPIWAPCSKAPPGGSRLSHKAICRGAAGRYRAGTCCPKPGRSGSAHSTIPQDRKSTRLNSSHVKISYAVFCLKKKKKRNNRNMISHG